MNCIAAVSSDWGLGKDNDLLFHISEDMKFFRKMTAGGTVILGRKTLESFPGGKPLPKRRHLVLSRNRDWHPEGVEVYHSVEDILAAVQPLPEENVWVIGGAEIYRLFLPWCRTAWITRVDAAPEADVWFPDLGKAKGWVLEEEGMPQEEGGLRYRFCRYRNTLL